MAATELTLSAPASAQPGQVVQVVATVKSLLTYRFEATVTIGRMNGEVLRFGAIQKVIEVGGTQVWTDSFTMPGKDVVVSAECWTPKVPNSIWSFDSGDEISIAEAEEVITGEIVSIGTSPDSGIDVGDRFRVLVTGKNTSSETVKLGMSYVVYKPSGKAVEGYIDEIWPYYTGPGGTNNFVEPPVYLPGILVDEPGRWTARIGLFGNNELLATQNVELFTTEEPTPELSAEIVSISTYPSYGWKLGNSFQLLVTAKNTSPDTQLLKPSWQVYKPSGDSVIGIYEEVPPGTGSGGVHEFTLPPPLLHPLGIVMDEVGQWSVLIGLWIGDELLDSQDKVLFTIGAPTEDEYPTSAMNISDFTPEKGDYRIGDTIDYVGSYYYRGKPQTAEVLISAGTGVVPSYFAKHVFPAGSLDLEGSMDWKEASFAGSVVITDDLLVGQSYSMQAIIKAADGAEDSETEYGIFAIIPAEGNGVVENIARIDNLLILMYAGFVIGAPSSEETPPVPGTTVGNQFRLYTKGTNLAGGGVQLGIRYTFTRPDGSKIADTVYQKGTWTSSGGYHEFYEPLYSAWVIDMEGEWLYKVELLGLDHQVGDVQEGVLFPAVVKKEIPGIGTIGDIGELILMMIMMMMMTMVMQMMQDPRGFMVAAGEKVEKVKEVAVPIIQIFTAGKGKGK